MSIPDPDPGELFIDMNMQLFGSSAVAAPPPAPTMSGFVKSYLSQTAKPAASYRANSVMHFYMPEQVPFDQYLGAQLCRLRPVARVGAMPDLAKPLFCPCGDGRRLREQ
jgi:hypothetical protein